MSDACNSYTCLFSSIDVHMKMGMCMCVAWLDSYPDSAKNIEIPLIGVLQS